MCKSFLKHFSGVYLSDYKTPFFPSTLRCVFLKRVSISFSMHQETTLTIHMRNRSIRWGEKVYFTGKVYCKTSFEALVIGEHNQNVVCAERRIGALGLEMMLARR
jgi:hypothetical protein